ncbi:MAG: RNA polymerase sigma factor [Bacteroidota bacterium]
MQENRHQVLNTCYRFLLDREDAEDVAQEVFIEVFQSIHLFKGESKLSTWIYRIAVTKCLDELKKRKRQKRISAFGKFIRLEDITNWISGGTMPDRNLNAKEEWNELLKALDRIPENQRVAFTLSKMDGFSNKEIAEIMKTSISAVESLISRAKSKVIKVLNENQKK